MTVDYSELRRTYPQLISADQLYRICHISKRTARRLLENGTIPCIDNGKKTHRYQIRLDDVIDYLVRRDRPPLPCPAPESATSEGEAEGSPDDEQRQACCSSRELRAYLEAIWADVPDAVSRAQASELSGYQPASISRWIRRGRLTAIPYMGHYLIPKSALIESMLAKYRGDPKYFSRKLSAMIRVASEDNNT